MSRMNCRPSPNGHKWCNLFLTDTASHQPALLPDLRSVEHSKSKHFFLPKSPLSSCSGLSPEKTWRTWQSENKTYKKLCLFGTNKKKFKKLTKKKKKRASFFRKLTLFYHLSLCNDSHYRKDLYTFFIQFYNLTAITAQAPVVLNLHGVTLGRLLKIQITKSSAEHNSFHELRLLPKIWAGTTLPTGAKCMTNPCLSKLLQKRAAARTDCKAETLSLNCEYKHGFIIRLFFWVTQPMPWLQLDKNKSIVLYRSPASPAVSCCPTERSSPQLKGGTQRSRVAPCQESQAQPWASGSTHWVTDAQVAPTATAHTAEPFQRKVQSDGEVWGRKSMATSQPQPLCSQQWGEK